MFYVNVMVIISVKKWVSALSFVSLITVYYIYMYITLVFTD